MGSRYLYIVLLVFLEHHLARGDYRRAAYRDHRETYARDAGAARELITLGETKPDPKLDPAELAAWTMIANTVLNLDEVLNKG